MAPSSDARASRIRVDLERDMGRLHLLGCRPYAAAEALFHVATMKRLPRHSHHGDRTRRHLRMTERELDDERPMLLVEPFGHAMELDARPAMLAPEYLHILPGDGARIRERLQRLVHRRLGGDPCREVTRRDRLGQDEGALIRGEELVQRLLFAPSQHLYHPVDVDQVDPDSDDVHFAPTRGTTTRR